MGIGNHAQIPAPIVQHLVLITPHGDWERAVCQFPVVPHQPHYPSWGLGTRLALRSLLPYSRLITPHGDWELGRTAMEVIAATTSLPLMGIGNPPLGAGADVKGRRAHYPSWGLGTRSASPSAPASHVSLPLMGIGNPSPPPPDVAVSLPHYPSWGLGTGTHGTHTANADTSLPLMGIGNLATWGEALSGQRLITPHGDWERARPSSP